MALLQPPGSRDVDPFDFRGPLQLPNIPRSHLRVLVLHPRQHLILAREDEAQDRCADAGHGHQTHHYTERRAVVRLLRVPVRVRSPDAGHVSDGVHEGKGGSALSRRARNGVRGPGVDLDGTVSTFGQSRRFKE